jgi:hypothetical protein
VQASKPPKTNNHSQCVFYNKKREKLFQVSLFVPRPAFEIIKVGKMWVKRKMQKNTAI